MAQDVQVEGPTAVSLQVNFLKARLKSLLVLYPAQYIDFRAATEGKAAAALGVLWLPCLPKIYCCGLWKII
jgi:hypothetical protein